MSTATAPAPVEPEKQRHTWADLYHERTHFEFIKHSRRWAAISGTLILISLLAFVLKGLNLGIDFEGGTQWQFTVASAKGSASAGDVRDVLDPLGLGDAKVLIVGDDSVRVQSADLSRAAQAKVTAALAKYAQINDGQVSVNNVGPTWGDKVSSKALTALIVFFFVIAAYLTFRFEWRMALAAIVAVIHDIIITVGVYAVTGFEVTPATVVAFLTILGFSLYDTVVVFDKVKDNTARLGTVRGDTYSTMVNRSLNQVLMRSINTSIVALLPVASLLFVGTYAFGGLALRDFALALFVGLLTGAYSSIFVATPVLAWLKERQPRYRALRERAEIDRAKAKIVAPVPPVVAGEPADVPVDGEDIDPGDDLPQDDVFPQDDGCLL
jgi:preprotein translocase subunit SecF